MRKRNGMDIALSIAVVVLAAILTLALISDRRKGAERAQAVSRAAEQEREVTEERRQAGEAIREGVARSIQDSFPGVVCWGDQSMLGNRYGNLPAELDEALDGELFSAIESDLTGKMRLYSAQRLKVEVVNMGVSNEGFSEILARTGARQLVVGEAMTIPAGTDRQDIDLTDAAGNAMRFAEQSRARFGETKIAGVTGRLYDGKGRYDKAHVKLAFGRDRAGQAVTVQAGTPVYTEGATQYRAFIPVLFFAEDEGVDAGAFVAGIIDILSAHGSGPYVLICTTQKDSDWDRALTETFGDRYIRNGKAVTAMKTGDYEALAKSAFANLKAQGVFDEIIRAVDAARAEIQRQG